MVRCTRIVSEDSGERTDLTVRNCRIKGQSHFKETEPEEPDSSGSCWKGKEKCRLRGGMVDIPVLKNEDAGKLMISGEDGSCTTGTIMEKSMQGIMLSQRL